MINPVRIVFRTPFGAAVLLAVATVCHAETATNFTDMSQREVTLAKPAQRIAVIPIPAASMLVGMDGGAQKLVGMHPFAGVAAREGMLSQMFPDVLHVRSDTVGNNFMPNIETLLSVKPDLVWQWGHRGEEIVAPLLHAGLTVATLNYGKEVWTQRWIQLMGVTLQQEKKAAEMIAWREKTIADLRRMTGTLNAAQRPRVLYLSHFNDGIQTFGATSHNNFDIDLAGGVSLNRDITGARTLNIEQVLLWDPDVILLGNFEAGLVPDDVYHHPMLGDLTAVKQRRVYKLPIGGFIWDAPNQETPLYWQWLAMIFHPQKFQLPLRDEIKVRYRQLYGYAVSDEQINTILQMPVNQGSQGYSELMAR
ncbi:corrinoid ABC transporter substrate-binding protein [Cedecea lapagei]|uniref:Corrinoid ABC transporter substrate-binding protein n=1 Tax=Cedecea lapagei TaxID=158823 RepID=A0A447V3W9_9ENTR|nr:ABC transporter substrate-binding protein [Cedecea lapagei]VEB98728.1 corrinoid ABC transporter substrate-binding protein [Cedecea lapagei]